MTTSDPTNPIITDSGAGGVDGYDPNVRFFNPHGILVHSSGNIFVTEPFLGHQRVRKIAPDGTVSTALTGRGIYQMAELSDGRILMADNLNNRIVRTDADGVSNLTVVYGNAGSSQLSGTGTAAQVGGPVGIAIDGNNLYIGSGGGGFLHTVNLSTYTTVSITPYQQRYYQLFHDGTDLWSCDWTTDDIWQNQTLRVFDGDGTRGTADQLYGLCDSSIANKMYLGDRWALLEFDKVMQFMTVRYGTPMGSGNITTTVQNIRATAYDAPNNRIVFTNQGFHSVHAMSLTDYSVTLLAGSGQQGVSGYVDS